MEVRELPWTRVSTVEGYADRVRYVSRAWKTATGVGENGGIVSSAC